MTTTSQLKRSEQEQKQKQIKQTTRMGTESQKQRSHRRLSARRGRRRIGEKEQGIRSINGRYKIERGRLRIGIYMYDPWT